MDDNKRIFKFFMTDSEGNEFTFEEKIDDVYYREQAELEYLLDQFKCFLASTSYGEDQLSRLQYLETEEWKHVLTSYGEWDPRKENIYNLLTKKPKNIQ